MRDVAVGTASGGRSSGLAARSRASERGSKRRAGPWSLNPAVWGLCFMGLSACGSCSKSDPGGTTPSASAASSGAVAELLPRCRGEAQRLTIPGEDVSVGDVALGPSGLLVGLIRTLGGKRVASVMHASLDLASSRVVDVGPAFGDDPPPSPRWNGSSPYVAFLVRPPTDGGARLRALRIARIEESALGRVEATIVQQADESTAFDVAWSEGGVGLTAWDEDAPSNADASVPTAPERGLVKVERLPVPGSAGEGAARRVASPETSDAEQPRLIARPSGFWLAWLARRPEGEAYSVEGPGEPRAFRWVEVVALDVKGDPVGPVRRVSSEKGRASAFDLARDGADLVVMVQDEAAPSEGAGARIVRHRVGEKLESADVVDAGVGHALADLVPSGTQTDAARWLAWTDTSEHTHMTPLGPGLVAVGRTSTEPSLDGARVLAAAPSDGIYALVGAGETSPSGDRQNAARPRPELRRFVCK